MSITFMMDGKEMKNVAHVAIYAYDEESDRIEITSVTSDQEEGLYERYSIYANKEEKMPMKKEDMKKNMNKKDMKKKMDEEEDTEAAKKKKSMPEHTTCEEDQEVLDLAEKFKKEMRIS